MLVTLQHGCFATFLLLCLIACNTVEENLTKTPSSWKNLTLNHFSISSYDSKAQEVRLGWVSIKETFMRDFKPQYKATALVMGRLVSQ